LRRPHISPSSASFASFTCALQDEFGEHLPIKFEQGRLLPLMNAAARMGDAAAAAATWTLLLRSVQQRPAGLTAKQQQQYQQQKHVPVAAAYHALIEAYVRANMFEQALEAVRELELAHGEEDPGSMSCFDGLRWFPEMLDTEEKQAKLLTALKQRKVRPCSNLVFIEP
jgi:pentatricopeptide repeat protein